MKVVIGVTTTKSRLGIFFYTLLSLKRQDFANFVIVVSLSKDPYLLDEGIDVVPEWMAGEPVEVRFVANGGPYRKLLPAIVEAGEEDIVVTADDDVLYADDWLSKLVNAAIGHPENIVCGRARRIRKNVVGRWQNYSNWPLISGETTGFSLLPIGCAGIAYRRNLLDIDFALDPASRKFAPTADDIWFRLASLRKNVQVYLDSELERGNANILHSHGLEQLNLYRPSSIGALPARELTRLVTRTRDYVGVPISRNDVAWFRSLELLKSRGQGLDL